MGSNTICSRAIPSLTLWCWCCSVMANTVVSNLPRVISWVHISLPRRPRRMPRIIFMHIQPFCQPCTQSQLWWHCHPEIDPSFPSALQCESKAWQQNATHTRAEITVAPGSRFSYFSPSPHKYSRSLNGPGALWDCSLLHAWSRTEFSCFCIK